MRQKGKKLIVMIPCFNEEKTLSMVIQSIPKVIPGISKIETLVIDDGSTDRSGEIAKKIANYSVTHVVNKGLGQSFRNGIEKALSLGADIIVNIDGDMQFNPQDIPQLVEPIISKGANVVTATRYQKYLQHNLRGRGVKNFGNKFFTWLINKITGQKLTDVSCGFRAYSRVAAMKLQLFGHFTYTHETFLDLVHKGYIPIEVPVKVRPKRLAGKSKVSSGLINYGNSALKIIVRGFRDHRPLDFFGSLGLAVIFLGTILLAVLLVHWLSTGSFTPYKSFGFVGGFLFAIGFIILVLALMADMMGRIKDLQEEILYHLKERNYQR